MKAVAAARYATALVAALGSIACGGSTPTEPDPVYEQKSESGNVNFD